MYFSLYFLIFYLCTANNKKQTDMKNNTKEWIQYGTAIGMLTSGVILTFLCFFLNHYKIEVEVLWYVAQCITFAGAVFGISSYIKCKFDKIEDEINSKISR